MLIQSSASPDVRFDNALLNEETVNAILAIGAAAPKDVELGVAVTRTFAALTDAQIAKATFSASEMAPIVKQAMDAMRSDPELASALAQADPGQLQSDILKSLEKGITTDGGHAATAVSLQNTMHDFFNWKDTDGETVVYMDGQPVMTVLGAKRPISKRAIQTFWVVFDVCCLIYAILDLPQCKPAKAAVEKLLQKLGSLISSAAGRFMNAIKGILPRMSEAQKGGRLAEAVKEVATSIGRAVAGVFEALWKGKGGLSALKDITMAVFQAAVSSWAKALYYVGQFVAGAIALISGIGAMVKKVVALIAALAALIYDAILLAQMGDQVMARAA